MIKSGLLVRLEAKPGKENALADFLRSALPLAQQEEFTVNWFALQLGPSTFGIFDTFNNEADRSAHLSGQIAQNLIANAPDLLVSAPIIETVDLLAVK